MKQVYTPANPVEGHMLAHLLEQNGIQAHLLGEGLQGGVGELPAAGLFQLMVADDDYDKARALILDWERANLGGEESARPVGRRFPFVTAALFLTVGLLSGFFFKLGIDASDSKLFESNVEYDQNGDGQTDNTLYYDLGASYASRLEADNNFDGRIDYILHYDASGAPESQEVDSDFNATFETTAQYRFGILVSSESDYDDNGVADVSLVFEHGVLAREAILDTGVGRIARVNHYRAGLIERADFDEDRDGHLELTRRYDRFGNVLSETARE